jgi:hypothetical protein
MMARIQFNWRTTLAGCASCLSGIALLCKSFVDGSFDQSVIVSATGLISTGIGLILSKDL